MIDGCTMRRLQPSCAGTVKGSDFGVVPGPPAPTQALASLLRYISMGCTKCCTNAACMRALLPKQYTIFCATLILKMTLPHHVIFVADIRNWKCRCTKAFSPTYVLVLLSTRRKNLSSLGSVFCLRCHHHVDRPFICVNS